MTTSSLRLAKWLTEYAHLIKTIRSDAGRVWSAMAELFELYFLHTFHTFGDITIAALMSTQQQQRQVTHFPCKARSLKYPLMWSAHDSLTCWVSISSVRDHCSAPLAACLA